MDPNASDARSRQRGGVGCLVAFLAGGAGTVLLVMGLLPATTEALPVGIGLLALAPILAIPSALALRRGLGSGDAKGPATPDGPAAPAAPCAITCPHCGGTAPLRLAEPTHTTCGYCRTRIALPPELARALGEGAAAVHRQTHAERQIEATIAALAAQQRAWTLRLVGVAATLSLVAAAVGLFGLATHRSRDDWHGYASFGVGGLLSVLALGLAAALLIPPMVRRAVGRWAAIRLPGEAGLGCRVCGAPLPAVAAPVLRCAACGGDNLASGEVLARVAQAAAHAEHGRLAVAQRKERGDELAAFALRAFPAVVALAWLAVGAAAGSAAFAIARDLEIAADEDERFLLLRAGAPPRACLAIRTDRPGELRFSSDLAVTLGAADLARHQIGPPLAPASLVGRQVDGARLAEVYRTPNLMARHLGRLASGREIVFPSEMGTGQLLCLDDVGPDDVSPGAGPALSLVPRATR